jgi:predicted GNAT family acetyltransferase
MNYAIEHDSAKHRFFTRIDGKECSAEYEVHETPEHFIDLYRTFVHPDLRGRGIAEKLLLAVTDFALKNGFSVLPTCSYAVAFYKKHSELGIRFASRFDPESGGSCRVPS